MTEWIDTHAHLTDKAYQRDWPGVLDQAEQAGVGMCITVATDLADARACLALCEGEPRLRACVGVHPHEAGQQDSSFTRELAALLAHRSVCGLGEIGLDYYYEHSSPERQRWAFEEQLELAADRDCPVVVHCRDAYDECFAILRNWGHAAGRVVFHCFSGDRKQARTLLDMGGFLSLTGIVTFKKAEITREVAGYVPSDRFFLETDCPYLAPEPKRHVRPNTPALMVHTAEKVAEMRGMTVAEVAAVTTRNACDFFQLKTAEPMVDVNDNVL